MTDESAGALESERRDGKSSELFSRGEYHFNLNGTPIGSYEETSALFAGSLVRQRGSTRRKEKHEPGAGVRRSKRRLVSGKGMGSNVSRHSGKGLSGRRAQSSGSLCKILAPRVGRVLNPCGDGGVRRGDRSKLSSSLPNRLDDKDAGSRGSTPETIYGDLYGQARPRNVELYLRKLVPQQERGGGDQGYDSERSPDDDFSLHKSLRAKHCGYSMVQRSSEMSFITKENTFEAKLGKGSRGLGLSVTGGIDSGDQYPGLIRIKRIFPHQPAWECGSLEMGDIILEANGTPLTGLTNHEALEVLRTTPSEVVLKVCRPPLEIFPVLLPSAGEPPPPPKRDSVRHIPLSSQSSSSSNRLPPPLVSTEPYGEFEVILKKVNGSLGFTLRKEDESVLGHYVRALVREPAISDGRIRPGDKIVSVNGADISPMSHEEAVAFLRQSGEEVKLRMYRDPAQTPVSALSPTESHKIFRPKPALRKEAMDMLCDLAVKKFTPSESSGSSSKSRLRSTSPGSSPRRRRLTKVPPDEGNDSDRLPGADALKKHNLRPGENLDASVGNEPPPAFGAEANPPAEPASMPPISTSVSEFSHKNPVYQSAHTAVHVEGGSGGGERLSDQNIPDAVFRERGGSHGLLKWKGVVFAPEDDDEDVDDKSDWAPKDKVLTVELCRGWNSRLGFSLQSSESATLISAIYPDSVAARDGRLQSGDEVIMINDEPTKHMKTSEVIDLLRRIRGTIAITVVRTS